MTPGQYTELFFIDEPSALAAGHRPCFECRRQWALAFQSCWPHSGRSAPEIDSVLHRERLAARPMTETSSLPCGAMVEHEGEAWLIQDGRMSRWSFEGYRESSALPRTALLLTPPSTVEVVRRGYLPL